MALTEFRKRVAQEYFRMDQPTAVGAYLAAGGKGKEPEKLGSEILRFPEVQAYLDELRAEREQEVGIDANWVLKKLKLLAEFNIRKFIRQDEHGNAVYDFSDATTEDWYCIGEYTVDVISKGKGDDVYEVERVKLKAVDKLKALELAGRHVNVKAFSDKLEVEVTDRASILERARARQNAATDS